MGNNSTSISCQILATQDLYGIGTRTGTYCQWIATLVAGIALPEEAVSIQTTTICFQCAVLGALVVITLRGSIAQPEVLIIVPLVFGGFVATQTFEQGTTNLVGLTGAASLNSYGTHGRRVHINTQSPKMPQQYHPPISP